MFILKIGQLEDENKMLRDRLKELEGTALTAINEKKTLSNELIKVRKSQIKLILPSIFQKTCEIYGKIPPLSQIILRSKVLRHHGCQTFILIEIYCYLSALKS